MVKNRLSMQETQFSPWNRKMPQASEQLSPCTTSTEPVPCGPEPQVLSPLAVTTTARVTWSLCSAPVKATAMRSLCTIREKKKAKSLSPIRLFATPWTVAYQASPSMGFSRQEYRRRLPFPSPGDLPDLGIKPRSPTLQADGLPYEPPGKPN